MVSQDFLTAFIFPHVCEVIQADPTDNNAKMALAEILEILNEPRKALDLVMQGTWHLPPILLHANTSGLSYRLPQETSRPTFYSRVSRTWFRFTL